MNQFIKSSAKTSVSDFFDRSMIFLMLGLLILLGCSLWVIVPQNDRLHPNLQIDRKAPVTVFSEIDFTVVDEEKTENIRKHAAESVSDYYKIEVETTRKIQKRCHIFFTEVRKRDKLEKAGSEYIANPNNDLQKLVEDLDKEALICLLRIIDNPQQEKKFDSLFSDALRRGIIGSPENLKGHSHSSEVKIIDSLNRRYNVFIQKIPTAYSASEKIMSQMLEYYDSPDKETVKKQLTECLRAIFGNGNMQYDKEFTEAKKIEAMEKQEPVTKTIKCGAALVRKSQLVTPEIKMIYDSYLENIKKKAIFKDKYDVIWENLLLCIIMISALGLYFVHILPTIAHSNMALWLIGGITIVSVLLNKAFYSGFFFLMNQVAIQPEMGRFAFPENMIYFALPIGFSSLLITVIFGVRTAIFVGGFVSFIAALQMQNQFQMMITGLLINAGCCLAVRSVQNYRSYILRAFSGTLFSSLIVGAVVFPKFHFEFFELYIWWDWVKWQFLFSVVTSLATTMLALVALLILEILFRVNTTMSLNVCSDFNHLLLKEMQMNAPGTYHHCLMVSTLAEQAAQDAGLNHIKARVCGLFHDAGKLVQSEFFIENSPGIDRHKDLDPTMSAMIIRSHAGKHGLEMAKKYKLNRIIQRAITQHHGDDLILYFYKKAQMLHPEVPVKEEDFRYPGPRPSDKEICIVMLADCCEAASRSLDHPTGEMLEQLVNDIFRNKIRSGQLDESHLTLEELATVRRSIINTLKHMNHGRITYPKDDKKDEDDLFVADREKLPPS